MAGQVVGLLGIGGLLLILRERALYRENYRKGIKR